MIFETFLFLTPYKNIKKCRKTPFLKKTSFFRHFLKNPVFQLENPEFLFRKSSFWQNVHILVANFYKIWRFYPYFGPYYLGRLVRKKRPFWTPFFTPKSTPEISILEMSLLGLKMGSIKSKNHVIFDNLQIFILFIKM